MKRYQQSRNNSKQASSSTEELAREISIYRYPFVYKKIVNQVRAEYWEEKYYKQPTIIFEGDEFEAYNSICTKFLESFEYTDETLKRDYYYSDYYNFNLYDLLITTDPENNLFFKNYKVLDVNNEILYSRENGIEFLKEGCKLANIYLFGYFVLTHGYLNSEQFSVYDFPSLNRFININTLNYYDLNVKNMTALSNAKIDEYDVKTKKTFGITTSRTPNVWTGAPTVPAGEITVSQYPRLSTIDLFPSDLNVIDFLYREIIPLQNMQVSYSNLNNSYAYLTSEAAIENKNGTSYARATEDYIALNKFFIWGEANNCIYLKNLQDSENNTHKLFFIGILIGG